MDIALLAGPEISAREVQRLGFLPFFTTEAPASLLRSTPGAGSGFRAQKTDHGNGRSCRPQRAVRL